VVALQRLEFAWMGSPDMIDASRIYTPADIARLPLLRQSRESGLNMIYDGWLRPHHPDSNIFTINSLIAMAGLTAAGFGVSCLPRDYFADMVSKKQLVIARTSTAEALVFEELRLTLEVTRHTSTRLDFKSDQELNVPGSESVSVVFVSVNGEIPIRRVDAKLH
jgi:DNA-binding transcriptional LysR family regulator